MAKLIRAINSINEQIKFTRLLLVLGYSLGVAWQSVKWHYELIDTTPAEVAYFQGLMDNE